MQFAIGCPLAFRPFGKFNVSCEATMRNPVDPVSTITWSIVWQVDVPGVQIVTLVNRMSSFPANCPLTNGPASTITDWVLFTGGGGAGVSLELLPFPSPHPERLATIRATAAAAKPRLTAPPLAICRPAASTSG